jgi:hypothetical protein
LQSQGAGFLLLEGEFAFQPAKLSILSWSDGRFGELLLSKNENLAPFCGEKTCESRHLLAFFRVSRKTPFLVLVRKLLIVKTVWVLKNSYLGT